MNGSTLFAVVVILVPLVAAIGAYVLLRGKDQPVIVSGCLAIVLGVMTSFVLTLVLYLAGWS